MLTLDSREQRRVALAEGAIVLLKAPSPRIVAAGRQAVREALDDDPDLDVMLAQLVFSEGVLLAAIEGWEGIGDAAGEPLAFSPEAALRLLGDTHAFAVLDREYVLAMSLREMEKNESAASSAGTSGQATAAKTTAGSPAGTDGAGRKPPRKTKPKTTAKAKTRAK